jgi:hypothetical protein
MFHDCSLDFLKEIRVIYENLLPTIDEIELIFNRTLLIVTPTGKYDLRREWERLKTKSHDIDNSLAKVSKVHVHVHCQAHSSRLKCNLNIVLPIV